MWLWRCVRSAGGNQGRPGCVRTGVSAGGAEGGPAAEAADGRLLRLGEEKAVRGLLRRLHAPVDIDHGFGGRPGECRTDACCCSGRPASRSPRARSSRLHRVQLELHNRRSMPSTAQHRHTLGRVFRQSERGRRFCEPCCRLPPPLLAMVAHA